jgi:hypothetical protein
VCLHSRTTVWETVKLDYTSVCDDGEQEFIVIPPLARLSLVMTWRWLDNEQCIASCKWQLLLPSSTHSFLAPSAIRYDYAVCVCLCVCVLRVSTDLSCSFLNT